MNRIVKQLEKSFELMIKRNWDKIYVSVDIHDTVLKSTYSTEIATEEYPHSLEVLKILSERKDVSLILWTCSKKEDIEKYLNYFISKGINFNYINSNPEVQDKSYADYSQKFYTNLILDDKAGFLPEEDWVDLLNFLKNEKV